MLFGLFYNFLELIKHRFIMEKLDVKDNMCG